MSAKGARTRIMSANGMDRLLPPPELAFTG
jgi:hypothetical protein